MANYSFMKAVIDNTNTNELTHSGQLQTQARLDLICEPVYNADVDDQDLMREKKKKKKKT